MKSFDRYIKTPVAYFISAPGGTANLQDMSLLVQDAAVTIPQTTNACMTDTVYTGGAILFDNAGHPMNSSRRPGWLGPLRRQTRSVHCLVKLRSRQSGAKELTLRLNFAPALARKQFRGHPTFGSTPPPCYWIAAAGQRSTPPGRSRSPNSSPISWPNTRSTASASIGANSSSKSTSIRSSGFGHVPAAKLTTEMTRNYIAYRRTKGIANGTINRELSLLRRAFNLARLSTPPRVVAVPYIPTLEERNVRKGFFEDEQYRALFAELPDYLQPLLAFAYFTGCRRGEILAMQWSQVDLERGVARLEAGTTKNDEARILPLVPEILEILATRKKLRDARYPQCTWVFFHEGERSRSFKTAWSGACTRAGLVNEAGEPEKLFHDLRRTGVRNLVRAGVPETVAIRISGHKTRSVFDRYNITSEADLKDAAEKLAKHLSAKREKPSQS